MSTHLNQFRTAADLIAELEAEAENFDAVGIAVGFEEGVADQVPECWSVPAVFTPTLD